MVILSCRDPVLHWLKKNKATVGSQAPGERHFLFSIILMWALTRCLMCWKRQKINGCSFGFSVQCWGKITVGLIFFLNFFYLQQKEVIKTDKASLRVDMCTILWEGKGPGFGELGGCAGTVFWEEALAVPLCGEVLELKFIEHIFNLLLSEKDKIFKKNFFLFVQISDYWSETSLLLNLQCIYEHQRLYYIPSLPENKSFWLRISLCTEVFYSWNWVALSFSPFFSVPSLL